jgi:Gram-negative bacterial TonB protein C-terminal
MKKSLVFIILSLFLLNSSSNFASNPTTSFKDGITPNIDTTIASMDTTVFNDTIQNLKSDFVVEEIPAEFPGGEEALQDFIYQNIQYPAIAKTHGIEGRVYVALTLDETGSIQEINFINSIGGGCEAEVTRVLTKMPLWKPKVRGGSPIKSERIFSFNFKL